MNDKISEIITLLKIADRYMAELERDELIGDDPRTYLMETIDEMERIHKEEVRKIRADEIKKILDSYEWKLDCNDGSYYKEISAEDIKHIEIFAGQEVIYEND